MKFGALIVARCKKDKEFKKQVLKELRRQMTNKKTSAECQLKLLKAIAAIEKV